MSIIKNVLFAVLIAMILQGVLLFNALAVDSVTTIPGDTTVSESTTESSSQAETSAPTLSGVGTTSGTRTSTAKTTTTTKKKTTTAYTSSGNGSYYTKSTTIHAPVPYYLNGQTYASSTSVDPNATTVTTVKPASNIGKNYYRFVWFYIPIIILCVAGLIFVNTKMAKKKNETDGNDLYSESKKSKQNNKKRIK